MVYPEESFVPTVGASVLVFGRHPGIVRWIGALPGHKKNRVGIELERPVGSTDGSKNGVSYFQCPKQHGVFSHLKHVFPNTPLIKAVVKLQSQWRERQARKLLIQNVWVMLDNYSENCEVEMESQLDKLEALVKHHQKNSPHAELYQVKPDEKRFVIPAGYDGVHLRFPMEAEHVVNLMKGYQNGKSLHYAYAFRLVEEIKNLLTKSPIVSDVRIGEGHLTVCGDTHGQFADVCTIFAKRGYPSPTNKFLFNGDFVDRGRNGVEVLLTLYAWKLVYPNSIFLNKGNHEARKLNEKYKFAGECIEKYDAALFELVQASFDQLPLCSVIEDEIFVVHGGLFKQKGVSLAQLRAIQHRGQPQSHSDHPELQLIEMMLWSDPKPGIRGCKPSSRGAGVWFGENITDKFLKKNGLRMVIRSHELVDPGYEVLHGGKVVTIFSASNYSGKNNNKGAYMVFSNQKPLIPIYEQFVADVSEFSFAKLEESTFRKLKQLIFTHRHKLALKLHHYDKSSSGFVSKVEWAKTMDKVMSVKLPWLALQPRLSESNSEGRINIVRFLERYRAEPQDNEAWEQGLLDRAAKAFFEHSGSLEAAFKVLDKNGDGKLQYPEFFKGLKSMNLGLEDETIFDLMRVLDKDEDNQLSYREFLRRFRVSFKRFAKQAKADKFLGDALFQIGTKLMLERDPRSAFAEFDKDGNGHITTEEFAQFLATHGIHYSPSEIDKLMKCIDSDGNGTIEVDEFVSAFSITDDTNNAWARTAVDKVCRVLMANKLYLRKAFRLFDINRDGKLDRDEFRTGLRLVNELLNSSQKLSEPEMDHLFKLVDKSASGDIDYEEFLAAFSVLDTVEPTTSRKKRKHDRVTKGHSPHAHRSPKATKPE